MSVTSAAINKVKNNKVTHGGDRFGFTLGGGCRGRLFDRLLGMAESNSSRSQLPVG